ncbi:MAG: AAA family ATPase [Vicinamibacterales bacterium]|nr:AAA family ATPase [Vicinamibacterales bacterium]
MTDAEARERAHLDHVTATLRRTLQQTDARLQRYARDIQEQKQYLWESRADMDHVEKVFTRGTIQQSVMTGETVAAFKARVARLLHSPYFGRFDFAPDGRSEADAVYVGVHHFADEGADAPLVYDWRAPISTMFYDHEAGPAHYDAPAGRIRGELRLKRQFRIRDGRMEFMLESTVNIMDDVLQEALSRASDEGMKQIVATIQRDQNAIIRDEHAPVLIIQGVAGSGKTSIALHRIAFLLYRFKETLTSKDILILSPNRVFAGYIANVLPELGEEAISEMGMEALAAELLDHKVRFQTFMEQSARLLDSDDEALRRRITHKASAAFLDTLDRYVDHLERTAFEATDVWVGRCLVPAWFIQESFQRHRGVAPAARVARVVEAIEQNIGIYYNHDLSTLERGEVRTAVRAMQRRTASLRATYKGLFDWMGAPELFVPAKGAALEYADVFPLVYLKMRLEGVDRSRRDVKHLIIDEMQDYTPVQYAVLARLFPCRKTILGDMRQSVNPYSASTVGDIQKIFTQAAVVTLVKSYRSTYEITCFAQRISPNPDLIAIERHGDAPEIVQCRTPAEELRHILQWVEAFPASGHTTAGIICKTQAQAIRVHGVLVKAGQVAQLLTADSTAFRRGVIVCTAHMAKGLEFDQVLVPFVTDTQYQTPMDRNLLYVACTRAMHRLTLTRAGDLTRWIPA